MIREEIRKMNECVIKTLHLKKEYGNKLAIDDFNMTYLPII